MKFYFCNDLLCVPLKKVGVWYLSAPMFDSKMRNIFPTLCRPFASSKWVAGSLCGLTESALRYASVISKA